MLRHIAAKKPGTLIEDTPRGPRVIIHNLESEILSTKLPVRIATLNPELCLSEDAAAENINPWTSLMLHGAAIVILNPDLVVLWRQDLCSSYNAVASLDISPSLSLTMISSYFKFRTPTGEHIRELTKISRNIKGEIIIGADTNAASTLACPLTNIKGVTY